MTQFSSRPPFNNDPEPYVYMWDRPRRANFRSARTAHSPRPEFDRPQHNPTNPILTEFRSTRAVSLNANHDIEWWAMLTPGYHYYRRGAIVDATNAQRDHARRVLTRLARLTKEEA